jgi:hypothetical protein
MAEIDPNRHGTPATAGLDSLDSQSARVPPEPQAWVRWASWLLIAAGFAYALYAIRVVSRLRYTTVHWDFWLLYDHLLEDPFPGNVFAPQNGHSMLLPGLIWLANMIVFRGDETPLFAIALALLISIAALLLYAVLRDRGLGCAERSLFVVTALGATFWLARVGILVSGGFTIICALPILGLLVGALALTPVDAAGSRRPARWWAAWAGALTASFSFGTGLAAWPALGMVAWARREPWRKLGGWCLGTLACTLLALTVLPRSLPGGGEAGPTIVLAPLESLKYWLQLIGSPAANTWAGMLHAEEFDPLLGLCSGIAGASLAGWGLSRAWRQRRQLTRAEWIGAALVAFNAIAAALVAVGRTSFFRYYPQNVFSDRYLWWTAYFWMGLVWLLARSGPARPALRARLHLIVTLLVLAGLWPAHWGPLRRYQPERAEAELIVTSLASGIAYPSFYLPILVDQRQILRLDAILRQKRLCYYARDGYASVGEPMERWFAPRSEAESAQLRPNHFYASLLEKKKAMRISGWLEAGPADLILLTDENRVVRGLGGFPADGNSFAAFAPVPEPGKGYQLWAVRGREARRVIPLAGVPRAD